MIWRESGTAYRPENIQEKDRYPTCSIMVWAGIMINGRTRLHVVANGTMTGQRCIDEVLLPHVRLFRGAVGEKFVFMDDNATCHRTLAVHDCLDSEGIQRLVCLARSPDLNPIENVCDALGRQVAGRNYPPTNKNTLIRALTEEWDKLPQQLLDNVVQKVHGVTESHFPSIMPAEHEEMMKAKGYLPYDLDTLPTKFIQKAKEELGETDEIRRSALEQFRKRILEHKKLKCPTYDEFLIQFLRARKYDLDKAIGLLQNYYNLAVSYPDFFDNLDKEKIYKCARSGFVNMLPFRDNDGCLLLTLKMGKWDPDDINVKVLFCTMGAVIFCQIIYPMNQICGVRVIFDSKDYSFKQMRCFVPRYLPLIAKALKIFLHGGNMQDVHKYIPKEVLPQEYGGDFTRYNDGDLLPKEIDKIYDKFSMAVKTFRLPTGWLDECSCDLSVINWPPTPRSANLNPIEHLWNVLEQGIKDHHTAPTSLTELWTALANNWRVIPVEHFQKLVEFMPHRVAAVIKDVETWFAERVSPVGEEKDKEVRLRCMLRRHIRDGDFSPREHTRDSSVVGPR
ncbi:alpha-tocopherol transfer protein-like [Trichonephila clavipes]|nr:alpha-tocopherol transfer protein-like [Trichonephila clavipes]